MNSKTLSIITHLTGFLFFGILFIFSLLFYKERILNFDPAFFLFKMIHFKEFSIELNRWGSLPSQLLPLWGIKMGLPLDLVVKLFSVSFILIYAVIFVLITLVFKNYKAAFALMLTLCIGFRHAFYYATAELYQGLALVILLWAVISDENIRKNKTILTLVGVLLIFIISFYHQLTLFAILFIIMVEAVGNKRYKDNQIIILSAFTIFWYFIRIFIFKSSDYEQERMTGLFSIFEHLSNLYYLPGTQYLKLFIKEHWFSIGITIFITIALLLYRKKYVLLVASGIYSFLFFVLIIITFYQGESPVMYENYYTIPGLFLAVLITYIIFGLKNLKLIVVFTIPLLIIHTIGIYNGHYTLTKRISYLERLIDNTRPFDERKFLIYHHNFPWTYTWVTWALPFETLLLSSLKSPDSSASFIVTDDMGKYDSLINNENIFLGPDWAITWFNTTSMDQQYFRLPSGGYRKLNSSPDEDFFFNSHFINQISIAPTRDTYISDADSFIVATLRINNKSGIKIPSIPTGEYKLCVSYHIYNDQGDMIHEYGNYSYLETDLADDLLQGVLITVPKKKGTYIIETDLYNVNHRWWGINSRFRLIRK
jgi:hypothetical protein